MIGYCPLDEDPPTRRPQRTAPMRPTERAVPTGVEECECNYLVMFFIVGVLVLAATDSMQK